MPIQVLVKTITFSDGTIVETGNTRVIALVGPNNSGKSSTLREILEGARNSNEVGPVLNNVIIEKSGSFVELNEWLTKFVQKVQLRYEREKTYTWLGKGCPETKIEESWKEDNVGLLNGIFCDLIEVEKRIEVADPQEPINFFEEAPSHPFHVLFKHPELERKVSEAFKAAFKSGIVLNRGGGKVLAFHLGEKPELAPDENVLSISYFQKLRLLPFLHRQGHGMRSFAGCILHAFTSPAFIQLLDEPEAFLHPPHAKLLGNLVGRSLSADKQLIIATHSGDFLRGLLDANPQSLRVIRLTRNANVNHVHELNAESIRTLWADPILRFSNVLDAIFHDGVILCESDSDCRFYSAMLSAVLENRGEIAPDVMFAASGGKDRMPVIIKSLRKLGVKIRVIADFDVLRDENTLSGIIASLGGNWDAVKPKWQNLVTNIKTQTPPLALSQVREQIINALDNEKTSSLSAKTIEKVKASLKATSPWHHAKLAGVNILPSGQPRVELNQLLDYIKQTGLFPVMCGEIERFAPTIGAHGPQWVSQVLERNLATDSELELARLFISDVFDIGPHAGWCQPNQGSATTDKETSSKEELVALPHPGNPIWNAVLRILGRRE